VFFQLSTATVLTANKLAQGLLATTSLTEAEAIGREVCEHGELDYERRKAVSSRTGPEPTDRQVLDRVTGYRAACQTKAP
jgi:hypothetical protein